MHRRRDRRRAGDGSSAGPTARHARSAGSRRRGRCRSRSGRSGRRMTRANMTMWMRSAVTSILARWLPSRMSSAISSWRPSSPVIFAIWLADGSVTSIQATVPAGSGIAGTESRPSDSTRRPAVRIETRTGPPAAVPGGTRPVDGSESEVRGGIVCTIAGSLASAVGRETARRTAVGRARLGRPGRQHTRPSRPSASAGIAARATTIAATRNSPTMIRAASADAQRSSAATTSPSRNGRSDELGRQELGVRVGGRVDPGREVGRSWSSRTR